MNGDTPSRLAPPDSSRLPMAAGGEARDESAPKAWPHAPVHRLSEHGVYVVTAGTLQKALLFDSELKRSLLERSLLALAQEHGWQLEAWAVFANHYHFVARADAASSNLRDLIANLHASTARELNRLDVTPGRIVWHNFWETRLTYQYAYFARLHYVHQNPVKHGLVPLANQYPWCSAAWFERTATPAQVRTIYGFKIDRVNVHDDF